MDPQWRRLRGGGLTCSPISSVSLKPALGMYNPYTLQGSIIVDGVLASTHSESDVIPVEPMLRTFMADPHAVAALAPTVYQILFAPFRALYHLRGPAWSQRLAHAMGEATGFADFSLTKFAGSVWSTL